MTVREYKNWINSPLSRKASEKDFFPKKSNIILMILSGKGTREELKKWKNFAKRHLPGYLENPTTIRRYALYNWGWFLDTSPKEKNNL